MENSQISLEQIQRIAEIASRHDNLKCVECAQEIKNYLISQGISGQRIKLYTGDELGRDSFIYDDSVNQDAISENGRHEGIIIIINNVEVVFDNHHPKGVSKDEWMSNLQFYSKIFSGQQFLITLEEF